MDKRKYLHLGLNVLAGSVLAMYATTVLADPFTLQGACKLTSTISGQGTCQLEFLIADSPTSTDIITQGLITVDGIAVATYMNDNLTPAPFAVGAVSGATVVTCGASHVVRAYVHKSTAPGAEERVGSLPAVVCPSAP